MVRFSHGLPSRWVRSVPSVPLTAVGLVVAVVALKAVNLLLLSLSATGRPRQALASALSTWQRHVLSPRTVARRVGIRGGMKVLCVSPGEGSLVEELAHIVGPTGHIEAVALEQPRIAAARAYLSTAGIENATIAFVPPTRLPYYDGQFDAVCCQSVLGRLIDRRTAFAEIRRVLRGAGRLSNTEFLGDPHFVARGVTESIIEAAGFEILERFGNVLAYTVNFRKPMGSVASGLS